MTPEVTILMSVYNGERWLRESIESILIQNFSNFEFLIINDGSTDQSLDIINKFAIKDSRIRVFDKPNTGLADSLNYGIERARSVWISRIDADDFCDPDRIARQIEFVKSDPSLVLVGSGLILLDQHGNRGKVFNYPNTHTKLVNRLKNSGAFFPHSSAMYKTDLVRKLGGYRSRIKRAEDHDLWLRLSEVGTVGCIQEPLVLIRKHEDQISNDSGGKRQLIDACVAKVSYWLRIMGHQDPVKNLSDVKFAQFHEWVEMHIMYDGTFELINFVDALKKIKVSEQSVLMKIFIFSWIIVQSPRKTMKWVRERFFGSKLARQLAIEWAAKGHV